MSAEPSQFSVAPTLLDYSALPRGECRRKLLGNISAVAQSGPVLWLASDEGQTLERLRWRGGRFTDALSFDLAKYFPLPRGAREIDVESLSIDGDDLWIAGSHSHVRRAPDDAKDRVRDPLKRLAQTRFRPRRYLLGKLSLTPEHDCLSKSADGGGLCLAFDAAGNSLTKQLSKDPHLAPFLGLPDKENGLDIEGIAARGGEVLLGLRGPVIRGYAVLLALAPKERAGRLHLSPIEGKPRYRKHFLDLGGLGVRDLAADGDDVIILAGPTMGLSGPWAVLRWRRAFGARRSGIVGSDALAPVLALKPTGDDHPEGISPFIKPGTKQRGWLIVYDHPQGRRLRSGGVYVADFFRRKE
jgi:hypothetical protein